MVGVEDNIKVKTKMLPQHYFRAPCQWIGWPQTQFGELNCHIFAWSFLDTHVICEAAQARLPVRAGGAVQLGSTRAASLVPPSSVLMCRVYSG